MATRMDIVDRESMDTSVRQLVMQAKLNDLCKRVLHLEVRLHDEGKKL